MHNGPRVFSLKLKLSQKLKWIQIQFSQKYNSSYRLNTLGPLCLWQCFFKHWCWCFYHLLQNAKACAKYKRCIKQCSSPTLSCRQSLLNNPSTVWNKRLCIALLWTLVGYTLSGSAERLGQPCNWIIIKSFPLLLFTKWSGRQTHIFDLMNRRLLLKRTGDRHQREKD